VRRGADAQLHSLQRSTAAVCQQQLRPHTHLLTLDPSYLPLSFLPLPSHQVVYASIGTGLFFAVITALEGHPELAPSVVAAKFWPTLAANWAIWPAAHIGGGHADASALMRGHGHPARIPPSLWLAPAYLAQAGLGKTFALFVSGMWISHS
jgi:hypothetical protein